MLIREIGIVKDGVPLVYSSYHKASRETSNLILTSGLISGLLTFAENFISPLEYFESGQYTVVFKAHKDKTTENLVIAYLISDKDKKIDKILKKSITPLLEKTLERFFSEFDLNKDLDLSKYEPFKEEIDKILGTNTKNIDERVSSIFL